MAIRITEIFYSIQGESQTSGIPTVFIRLTGCPMRCTYCDTAYAFHGGHKFSINEILDQVAAYQTRYVTVTGGEPLAQLECFALLTALCDAGYAVSLETGGAISISEVDARVMTVLDIKTPASGEEHNNTYANLEFIKPNDNLKFVICDRDDYEWSKNFVTTKALTSVCEVFFSPSSAQVSATDLAEWILKDQLTVRLQVQLHKILWHDARGR